jgi:hypothetical protein
MQWEQPSLLVQEDEEVECTTRHDEQLEQSALEEESATNNKDQTEPSVYSLDEDNAATSNHEQTSPEQSLQRCTEVHHTLVNNHF